MSNARIVIDPGHGGHSDIGRSTATGVRGVDGTLEKDLNLQLASLVCQKLGGLAQLTRHADENLPLGARADLARRSNADVFLSLHANDGRESGTGAWVHERAGASSHRLAEALQQQLGRWGGGAVHRGPFAVLTPERLGGRTAACLLELDQLSGPAGQRRRQDPRELERVASAIAAGVRGHLERYGRAEALWDGNPADWDPTDYEPPLKGGKELAELTSNRRNHDDKRVSTLADAQKLITAFKAEKGKSAWRTLDRAQVADRLDLLVTDYRLFNQGVMPLCGPAAFFTIWTKRDPCSFARFATTLFNTGKAKIGSMNVAPTSKLLNQDYAAMRKKMGLNVTEQADWMVMSALRNNDDALFVWEGDPDDSILNQISGSTTSAELADWLRATGLYKNVQDKTSAGVGFIDHVGLPDAEDILMVDGVDVACKINTRMVWRTIGAGKPGRFGKHFADHWVVLNGEITGDRTKRSVEFNFWTYGQDFFTVIPKVETFADDWYGAINCHMK